MQTVSMHVEPRTNFGKSSSKVVRNEGRIPVVIYSKDGVKHGSVTHGEVKHLVYTPDFKIAELTLDGASQKCIMQDIQFHPVTDNIMHIDFLELVPNHPIKVEVPVKPEGVSPGVKSGGKFSQSLRRVKIKCTPESIVDVLTVDISNLKLGNVVRVDEINLPDGIELMTDGRIPIASVVVPRALKSAEATARLTGEATPEEGETEEGGAADGDAAE